jgi:hypothetical protein
MTLTPPLRQMPLRRRDSDADAIIRRHYFDILTLRHYHAIFITPISFDIAIDYHFRSFISHFRYYAIASDFASIDICFSRLLFRAIITPLPFRRCHAIDCRHYSHITP